MSPHRSTRSLTAARLRTAAVQGNVRRAEAELRETNGQLAETEAGTVMTKKDLEAALVQNLHVEGQLHDAVKELQVVKELLETAEDADDSTVAGQRSGEGAGSVRMHMASALEPSSA